MYDESTVKNSLRVVKKASLVERSSRNEKNNTRSGFFPPFPFLLSILQGTSDSLQQPVQLLRWDRSQYLPTGACCSDSATVSKCVPMTKVGTLVGVGLLTPFKYLGT